MAIEEAETDAAAMAIEELKRRRFAAFVECVGSVGLSFFRANKKIQDDDAVLIGMGPTWYTCPE